MASVKEAHRRANRIVAEFDEFPLTGEGDKLLMLAKETLRRLDGLK